MNKFNSQQATILLGALQVLALTMPATAANVQSPTSAHTAQSINLTTTLTRPSSSLQVAAQPANTTAETQYEPTGNSDMSLPGFEWQLPCEGKFQPKATAAASALRLQGTVTAFDVDADFGQLVDSMLDAAVYKSTKMTNLDNAVAHYRKPNQQKLADIKDATNYVIPFRGNGVSSEAADVILDEKIKIKDKASAEYARQRYIDDLHPRVIAKTLQLAMAVGTPDKQRREELTKSALNSLTELVGKDGASAALQKVQSWSKDIRVPEQLYGTANSWDVDFFRDKLKDATKLGMEGDPVIVELKKRLQKYNHKTMASRVGSKVVTGGLDLCSWIAPGFMIPIACEVANATYVMSTGGPEESKLIKELYYDKRVESRYRTINEEAQIALTQYQNALNVKNPVLLVCSESVLTQLVGAENIGTVLGGRTLLTHRVPGQKTIETAQSNLQSTQ